MNQGSAQRWLLMQEIEGRRKSTGTDAAAARGTASSCSCSSAIVTTSCSPHLHQSVANWKQEMRGRASGSQAVWTKPSSGISIAEVVSVTPVDTLPLVPTRTAFSVSGPAPTAPTSFHPAPMTWTPCELLAVLEALFAGAPLHPVLA